MQQTEKDSLVHGLPHLKTKNRDIKFNSVGFTLSVLQKYQDYADAMTRLRDALEWFFQTNGCSIGTREA